MKRGLIFVLSFVILAIIPHGAAQQREGDPPSRTSHPVATALDHLTVIEYDEPVVEAAVGSSAFQIERQDNKVFIKPLKVGALTNLFVWTASNQQSSYELSVGEVANMDSEIHIASPRSTSSGSDSAQKLVSPDGEVTRTLLGLQAVNSFNIKTPKGGIGIRFEEVFRNDTALFIRYSLENNSTKSYRVALSTLNEVRVEHPTVSLVSFKNRQLDQRTMAKLGVNTSVAISGVHDSADGEDIAPGGRTEGIISVPRFENFASPMVMQLVFEGNVKAMMVL